MKKTIHLTCHSPALLEELEPRQLFSAGVEALLLEDAAQAVLTLEQDDGDNGNQPVDSNIQSLAQQRNELVVIDTDVEGYQQLLNLVLSQDSASERNIEVVVLDNDRDGVSQLSDLLASRSDLDAVHLISHGSDGEVDVGNTQLNFDTLSDNLSAISGWGEAFADDGELLIYGCDLASTDLGVLLVDALSAATGQDVAASDDLTGASGLGGDWDLEYRTGDIQTAALLDASLQDQWQQTLAADVLTGGWGGTATGVGATTSAAVPVVVNISFGGSTGDVEVRNITNTSMSTTGFFSNTSVQGAVGLYSEFMWDRTPESGETDAAFDAGTITVTISFDQPVVNPIIHIDKLGGSGGGISNSSQWTVQNPGATLTKLAGTDHLEVSSTSYRRTPNMVTADSGAANWDGSLGTAAGSIQVNGIYTSLTLVGTAVGVEGAGGDGLVFMMELRAFNPAISSNGGGATGAVQVMEGSTAVTTVSAADPQGGSVTYTIAGGADAARFQINSSTGQLSFVSAPDFELPTDGDGNNLYDVVVQASTASGGSDTQTLTVEVLNSQQPQVSVSGVDAQFTEDGGAVQVDPSLLLSDGDSAMLQGATVSIGSGYNPSQDQLLFSNQNGITGSWNAVTGTLSLSGSASVADYQTALRSVQYSNGSQAPSVDDRTVLFSVSDGFENSSPASVVVRVTSVNDLPVFTSPDAVTMNENSTLATTVQASDADSGSLTYTVSGGGDQSFFNIDNVSGELSFNAPPDFETPQDFGAENTYKVEVTADDGDGGRVTQMITVTVINLNEAPFGLTMPAADLNEHTDTSGGVVVGTLSSSDQDAGDSVTYELVGGPDQGRFSLQGDQLVFDDGVLDYESQASYSVTVRATDSGGLSTSQSVTVAVNDLNEAPQFISAGSVQAYEDSAFQFVVQTADPDTGASLTLSASNVPAWLQFTDQGDGTAIVSGTPTVTEVGDYTLTLTASDGTLSAEQALSVTVVAVNDAPIFSNAPSFSVAEDSQVVGTFSASDEEGDALSYAITGGADAALFSVDSVTGAMSFNALQDYENPSDADADRVYHVEVTVSDNQGGQNTQAVSVTLTNINEAPTDVSPSVWALDEGTNTAGGYSLGVLNTADPDIGDAFTYTLIPGLDSAVFSLGGVSGNELMINAGVLDAETKAQYQVTVRSTDSGGLSVEKLLQLEVNDVNEGPVIDSVAPINASEDQPYTYAVTASDPDNAAVLSITHGGLPAWLTLTDHGDGTATLSGTPAQADVGAVAISLTVSDGSLSSRQDFTLTVAEVNDAPVFTGEDAFTVTESTQQVGTLSASDEEGDALSYAVTGGVDAGVFNVDANSGALSFNTQQDYENPSDANADGIYEVEVTVSDGRGGQHSRLLTVTLTNVNEIPFSVTPNQFALDEGVDTGGGYTLGVLSTSDPDSGDSFTYSLVGGTDSHLFRLGGVSGNELIIDAGLLDAEGQSQYQVTVRSTDSGGLSREQVVQVSVNDVNEGPSITSVAPETVDEDQPYTYVISAADPDTGAVLSISHGGLPAWLTLTDHGDGTATLSGTPSQADVGPLDISLRVSDGSLSSQQNFTLTVVPINDAPIFSSTPSFSVAEDSQVVGTLAAIDEEGDVLSYAITGGTDAALFSVDANSGALSFNAKQDFESPADTNADRVYNVEVTVSDNQGGQNTQTVAVTITNVNEAPTAIAPTAWALDEGTDTGGGYSLGALSTSDPDAGDSFTYAVLAGADSAVFSIGGASGNELVINAGVLDAESKDQYLVTLQSRDSGGLLINKTITVTVNNINEAAVFVSEPELAAVEGLGYRYEIQVTDLDSEGGVQIIASQAPDWMSLQDNGDGTALLWGVPGIDDVGIHAITLQAFDGEFTTQQTFSIEVLEADKGPIFVSTDSWVVEESQTLVGVIKAQHEQTVHYALEGADSAWFVIESATGELTFVEPPDYEDSELIARQHRFDFTVVATNETGLETRQDVVVSVANVNEEPEFLTVPNEEAVAGLLYSAEIVASDADSDQTLVLSAQGLPAWLSFEDQGNGRAILKGTPSLSDLGRVEFSLSVSDGVDQISTSAEVSVVGGRAPVFDTSNYWVMEENRTHVGVVAARSVDGSAVTYELAGGADASQFVIDPLSGELQFSTSPDFEKPTSYSGENLYQLTVSATDIAGKVTTADLTVEVKNVGAEPEQALPSEQTVSVVGALEFSTANGNAIVVGDSDSSSNMQLQVRLSVEGGRLELGSLDGIRFVNGQSGESSMVLEGSEADLNHALNGLVYTPADGSAGNVDLNVETLLGAGLLGRYDFANGDARDSSFAGQRDGSIVGQVSIEADDQHQYVMNVEQGNGAIQIEGLFGKPDSVSLMGWIRPLVQWQEQEIISLGDNVVLAIDEQGQLVGKLHDGDGWQEVVYQVPLTDDWHHVAFTFDQESGDMALFVDGERVASEQSSETISYTLGSDSYIAAWGMDAEENNFEGKLADIRIYGRSLSDDEVHATATLQPQTVAASVVIVETEATIVEDRPPLPTELGEQESESPALQSEDSNSDPVAEASASESQEEQQTSKTKTDTEEKIAAAVEDSDSTATDSALVDEARPSEVGDTVPEHELPAGMDIQQRIQPWVVNADNDFEARQKADKTWELEQKVLLEEQRQQQSLMLTNFQNDDHAHHLLANIDTMRKELDDSQRQQQKGDVEVEFYTGVAVSFTAGVVSWVLRGGALMTSLMSSVSVLKGFDPLAVVFKKDNKSSGTELSDQKAAESLFDGKNKDEGR